MTAAVLLSVVALWAFGGGGRRGGGGAIDGGGGSGTSSSSSALPAVTAPPPPVAAAAAAPASDDSLSVADGGDSDAAAAATGDPTRRRRRRRGRLPSSDVIKRDERVILFPTAARRATGSSHHDWDVPVHGWIFEPEEASLRRRAFLALLRSALDIPRNAIGNDDEDGAEEGSSSPSPLTVVEETTSAVAAGDDEASENIEEQAPTSASSSSLSRSESEILSRRIRPFIVDNERNKRITVKVGDNTYQLNERSGKNGHFESMIHLTDEEVAELGLWGGDSRVSLSSGGPPPQLRVETVSNQPDDDRMPFVGVTHLVPPRGLSVISDIDDTIKISNVGDTKLLLRNTFLEEFRPVPGMAALYRRWSTERGASFHYVSSSPWQLYEELSKFLGEAGFPSATFHLKSVRLKDKSLFNLFADPMKGKINAIETILDAYPDRTFVLVGDTGERDPEVYGEMVRRYGDRIWRVYLRDVTDEEECALEPTTEGCGDRMGIAFEGVEREKWMLFTNADDVVLPEGEVGCEER